MHQTGELRKRKTEHFSFTASFCMKRADNFCILPLLTYSAHSAGLTWQEENGAKFIWPLSFFFPLFSILADLQSLRWLSYELFVQQLLCSDLCFSKNWKNLFTCSFFFFFFGIFLSPIGSCSLYTCRQGGAYLSCGKLPYKNRLHFALSQSFSSLIQALVDDP